MIKFLLLNLLNKKFVLITVKSFENFVIFNKCTGINYYSIIFSEYLRRMEVHKIFSPISFVKQTFWWFDNFFSNKEWKDKTKDIKIISKYTEFSLLERTIINYYNINLMHAYIIMSFSTTAAAERKEKDFYLTCGR